MSEVQRGLDAAANMVHNMGGMFETVKNNITKLPPRYNNEFALELFIMMQDFCTETAQAIRNLERENLLDLTAADWQETAQKIGEKYIAEHSK